MPRLNIKREKKDCFACSGVFHTAGSECCAYLSFTTKSLLRSSCSKKLFFYIHDDDRTPFLSREYHRRLFHPLSRNVCRPPACLHREEKGSTISFHVRRLLLPAPAPSSIPHNNPQSNSFVYFESTTETITFEGHI